MSNPHHISETFRESLPPEQEHVRIQANFQYNEHGLRDVPEPLNPGACTTIYQTIPNRGGGNASQLGKRVASVCSGKPRGLFDQPLKVKKTREKGPPKENGDQRSQLMSVTSNLQTLRLQENRPLHSKTSSPLLSSTQNDRPLYHARSGFGMSMFSKPSSHMDMSNADHGAGILDLTHDRPATASSTTSSTPPRYSKRNKVSNMLNHFSGKQTKVSLFSKDKGLGNIYRKISSGQKATCELDIGPISTSIPTRTIRLVQDDDSRALAHLRHDSSNDSNILAVSDPTLLPTPPSSTFNSPASKQYPQNPVPFVRSILCKPFLHASVKALSEKSSLDMFQATTLWTAIELKAETFTKLDVAGTDSIYASPLAVVIVLDNSILTSQLSLEKACDQVLHIAKLLCQPDDRLEVLLTMCNHTTGCLNSDFCSHVHPLQTPDLKRLYTELSTTKYASQGPTIQYPRLSDVIAAGIDTLQGLDDGSAASQHGVGKELILISASSVKSDFLSFQAEKIHLHCICPSIIPCSTSAPEFVTSFLNSVLAAPLDKCTSDLDLDKWHLAHIEQLIYSCRTRTYLGTGGHVTNVSLHISPGPDATIEQILGPTHLPRMSAGQTSYNLVKLRIKSLHTLFTQHDRRRDELTWANAHANVIDMDDAILSVELLAKQLSRELLTVDVHYRHSELSGLPNATEFVAHETTWIRRPVPEITSASQFPVGTRPDSHRRHGDMPLLHHSSSTLHLSATAVHRCDASLPFAMPAVQKALIMTLAGSSQDPMRAFEMLSEVFDADGHFAGIENTVPDFLALVREELKFRNRLYRQLPRFAQQQQGSKYTHLACPGPLPENIPIPPSPTHLNPPDSSSRDSSATTATLSSSRSSSTAAVPPAHLQFPIIPLSIRQPHSPSTIAGNCTHFASMLGSPPPGPGTAFPLRIGKRDRRQLRREEEDEKDPAARMWRELRRASGRSRTGSGSAESASRCRYDEAVLPTRGARASWEPSREEGADDDGDTAQRIGGRVDTDLRKAAARNRRSVGEESLASLMERG